MQEIHHFFHSLFSLTLDFRVRLFNILALGGTVISLIMALLSLGIGSFGNVLINLLLVAVSGGLFLCLLAENQEKIFSAKELYEAVWGSCAGTDTSTVRRHIFNLRVKIGAEDTDEYDIVSVYGKGYLFTCR